MNSKGEKSDTTRGSFYHDVFYRLSLEGGSLKTELLLYCYALLLQGRSRGGSSFWWARKSRIFGRTVTSPHLKGWHWSYPWSLSSRCYCCTGISDSYSVLLSIHCSQRDYATRTWLLKGEVHNLSESLWLTNSYSNLALQDLSWLLGYCWFCCTTITHASGHGSKSATRIYELKKEFCVNKSIIIKSSINAVTS